MCTNAIKVPPKIAKQNKILIVPNHLVMKKLMIALAFVGLASTTTAMAQESEVPAKKYSVATNSFWANWFVSAGVSGTSYYTSQESGVSKFPISNKRGTIGFTAAVGKGLTPSIGLRTKFDFLKGKQVNTENNHPLYTSVTAHEDVMFNLSNMFCGYNEERVWNAILYAGIGVASKLNDGKNADIYYTAGWLNNFRVSKRVQLFADLSIGATEGSLDQGPKDNWSSFQKNKHRHWDKNLRLDLGVTYNLGKCNWDKVPDVEGLMAMNKEQMDALNQSLKEQQDENARLREMLSTTKNQPVVENNTNTNGVSSFVGTSSSVFFNINSDKVASRKDLVNVKELAEYAKANNAKIVVTGYADSKTGSVAFNQKLSERRANTVANELVKMGVNRDNIITEGKGGVMNLSPFSYNRRATVKLQ